MAVGNIYESDHVNSILAAGRADLVALARPHLVDPMWTLRAAAAARLSRSPGPAPISRRNGPARAQSRARSGAEGVRLARRTMPSITGGGTGIGAAIARALGAEGAKLTLSAGGGKAGGGLRHLLPGESRGPGKIWIPAFAATWSRPPTSPCARKSTAPSPSPARRRGRSPSWSTMPAPRRGCRSRRSPRTSGATCWRSISTACSIAARRLCPTCSPPRPGGSSRSPRWRGSTASPTPRPISPPSTARSA